MARASVNAAQRTEARDARRNERFDVRTRDTRLHSLDQRFRH